MDMVGARGYAGVWDNSRSFLRAYVTSTARWG